MPLLLHHPQDDDRRHLRENPRPAPDVERRRSRILFLAAFSLWGPRQLVMVPLEL
jgi:hypothetical protein